MTIKEVSPKKRKAQDRDARIKATYYSLPEGAWSIRHLARLFGVSRMTAWYAIHGRNSKKK